MVKSRFTSPARSIPWRRRAPALSPRESRRRRHRAASRRPGFSKRQLAAGLDEAGIGYLHLQKLGTPKEGRDAARSGNLARLFDIYERQLATPEAREQLDELTAIVNSGRPVCLLCYERDVDHCHRKRIAELICERTRMTVEHLAAPLF